MSLSSQLTSAFPCFLKWMVLPLIMNTEKNFKQEKILKFNQFLKIAAQAFETVDFLNIFLRFWGF